MRHRLDLRSNAMDSLNEGLRKYREAQQGDIGAHKFAVLHFAHFMELLLKAGVAKEHPLLIYTKPAAHKIEGSLTIGLGEAINVLRNAGFELDSDLVLDLEWLKKIRNNIEHHEFDLDTDQVRTALGRILRAAVDLVEALELPELTDEVAYDCREMFDQLLDEYTAQLKNAQATARDSSKKGETTHCSYCGELDTAYEDEGEIVCVFCGETEPLRECVICTEIYRDSECKLWNDEHAGPPDYACTYCEDRMFGGD